MIKEVGSKNIVIKGIEHRYLVYAILYVCTHNEAGRGKIGLTKTADPCTLLHVHISHRVLSISVEL